MMKLPYVQILVITLALSPIRVVTEVMCGLVPWVTENRARRVLAPSHQSHQSLQRARARWKTVTFGKTVRSRPSFF